MLAYPFLLTPRPSLVGHDFGDPSSTIVQPVPHGVQSASLSHELVVMDSPNRDASNCTVLAFMPMVTVALFALTVAGLGFFEAWLRTKPHVKFLSTCRVDCVMLLVIDIPVVSLCAVAKQEKEEV